MGTFCIYCKRSTAGDMTRAHVFPEALGNREIVLPAGTVCGPCNHYCGHELDTVFVSHPTIAMALHYWNVPGKRGKVREVLGTVRRRPAEAGLVSMRFEIEQPQLTIRSDGSTEVEAKARTPKGFRHDLFRRALHHVGLNVVARLEGAEFALNTQFDAVRRYVREPKSRSEAWPYAEHSPALRVIPGEIRADLVPVPNGKVVALQIFQSVYAVDLLNSGDLKGAAEERGVKFIGAEVKDLPAIVIRMRSGPQPGDPPAA